MANKLYRKAYDEDLEDEIEREEAGTPEEEEPQFDKETDPFAKRYADLRRGSQKALSDKDAEIANLRAQVADKSAVKPPKSPEEVKAWMQRYPDVSDIVRTIIMSEIAGYDTSKAPDFDRVKELEEKIARNDVENQKKIAIEEILKVHPDFNSLIDDSTEKGRKFHAWVAEQDEWVQYALYENETKSRPAINAVTLYKTENKGFDRDDRKRAAAPNGRSSGPAPKESGNVRFSESMVERMSAAEYERNSDAIEKAIRDGEFDYDLSEA